MIRGRPTETTGHGDQRRRRAISGPLTPVASGLSRSLAGTPPRRSGRITGPDGTDSQADSAGSIPVTRSNVKTQVRATVARPGPCCFTVVTAFRTITQRGRAHRPGDGDGDQGVTLSSAGSHAGSHG